MHIQYIFLLRACLYGEKNVSGLARLVRQKRENFPYREYHPVLPIKCNHTQENQKSF